MLDTISMAEQLSGEYRTAFEKADLHSTFDGKNVDKSEDKLMELYNLLITAQEEGTPLENVVGEDIEEFCKKFFLDHNGKSRFQEVCKKVYGVLKWIFICTLVDVFLLEKGENILTAQSNAAPYLYGLAFGLVAEAIVTHGLKPMIFKNKKMKPIHYYGIVFGLFALAVTVAVVLAVSVNGTVSVNAFPLLLISGVYVLVYLLVRSVWRYKKFGRITKMSKQEKKARKEFNAEVQEQSLVKPIAEVMAKRYQRLNKRNMKKGKPEFTQEEFAEKIRTEVKRTIIGKVAFVVIISIMVLIPTIFTMISINIWDGLIFGLIMSVVEIGIYLFFFKAEKTNSKVQLYILEQCEEYGVDLFEYVERISK